MSKPADFPCDSRPPPLNSAGKPDQTVRAYFRLGQRLGQYLAMLFIASLTIGLACFLFRFAPFPGSLFGVLLIAAGCSICWFVGRHDYAWVELTADKLRAQHLYTKRIVEFPIDEVDRLEMVDVTPRMLFGPKRVIVRLWDERQPLLISISDPAMKNAKELIAALNDRLTQRIIAGEINGNSPRSLH